jgi:ABC-type uncharacterized transport system substrate-binding protein
VNPNNPNVEPQLRDLRATASGLGLQIVALFASDENEIDRVFATLIQQKIQALLVTADGFFFGLQDKLATLAARHAVPTFYPLSDYVLAAGLISYGANLAESWRQDSNSREILDHRARRTTTGSGSGGGRRRIYTHQFAEADTKIVRPVIGLLGSGQTDTAMAVLL